MFKTKIKFGPLATSSVFDFKVFVFHTPVGTATIAVNSDEIVIDVMRGTIRERLGARIVSERINEAYDHFHLKN